MLGKVFGRLTVRAKAPKTDKYLKWLCLCSCGKSTVVRGVTLRAGKTLSCGCLRDEAVTKHGGAGTHLYEIWINMRRRCYDKNNREYSSHGGIGITYPTAWDDFAVFKRWAISSGYNDKLTLGRKDVNKGYSKDNCIWVDRCTQAANRRKQLNRSSKFIGVYKTRNGKWEANVRLKHKHHYLGHFDTEIEAAKQRDAFVKSNNFPHKLNFEDALCHQ